MNEAIVKSDALVALRALAEALPGLAPVVGQVPRLSIVIDANRLLDEIHWRVHHRRDRTARSALEELVANGTVVALAPTTAREEVRLHLRRVVVKRKVSLPEAEAAWERVQAWIRFFRPEDRPSPRDGFSRVRSADLKDVPYYAVWEQLGAHAIYTRDHHLMETDAPVLTQEIVLRLRDDARDTALELSVAFGGTIVLFAGWKSVQAAMALVIAAARAFSRLPPPLQAAIGLAAAGLLLNQKSRAAILSSLRSAPEKIRGVLTALAPHLSDVGEAHGRSLLRRDARWVAIRSWGRATRRGTARDYARTILAESLEPLTITQLIDKMQRAGYRSDASSFPRYLRRLLRADSTCEEVSPGRWSVIRFA